MNIDNTIQPIQQEERAPEIRYFSPSTKGFYSSYIHNIMPDDCVELTDKEYKDFFIAQGTGKELSIDNKGKPKAVVRIETPEQASIRLKDEARQLLKDNDFRWSNQIKWAGYSNAQKTQITNYYIALVAIVNGESTTIPTPITTGGII